MRNARGNEARDKYKQIETSTYPHIEFGYKLSSSHDLTANSTLVSDSSIAVEEGDLRYSRGYNPSMNCVNDSIVLCIPVLLNSMMDFSPLDRFEPGRTGGRKLAKGFDIVEDDEVDAVGRIADV